MAAIDKNTVADALLFLSRRVRSDKCELSEQQYEAIMEMIEGVAFTPISKSALCDMLKISRSTFDDRVARGIYPEGQHRRGFKEKVWNKRDFV